MRKPNVRPLGDPPHRGRWALPVSVFFTGMAVLVFAGLLDRRLDRLEAADAEEARHAHLHQRAHVLQDLVACELQQALFGEPVLQCARGEQLPALCQPGRVYRAMGGWYRCGPSGDGYHPLEALESWTEQGGTWVADERAAPLP